MNLATRYLYSCQRFVVAAFAVQAIAMYYSARCSYTYTHRRKGEGPEKQVNQNNGHTHTPVVYDACVACACAVASALVVAPVAGVEVRPDEAPTAIGPWHCHVDVARAGHFSPSAS